MWRRLAGGTSTIEKVGLNSVSYIDSTGIPCGCLKNLFLEEHELLTDVTTPVGAPGSGVSAAGGATAPAKMAPEKAKPVKVEGVLADCKAGFLIPEERNTCLRSVVPGERLLDVLKTVKTVTFSRGAACGIQPMPPPHKALFLTDLPDEPKQTAENHGATALSGLAEPAVRDVSPVIVTMKPREDRAEPAASGPFVVDSVPAVVDKEGVAHPVDTVPVTPPVVFQVTEEQVRRAQLDVLKLVTDSVRLVMDSGVEPLTVNLPTTPDAMVMAEKAIADVKDVLDPTKEKPFFEQLDEIDKILEEANAEKPVLVVPKDIEFILPPKSTEGIDFEAMKEGVRQTILKSIVDEVPGAKDVVRDFMGRPVLKEDGVMPETIAVDPAVPGTDITLRSAVKVENGQVTEMFIGPLVPMTPEKFDALVAKTKADAAKLPAESLLVCSPQEKKEIEEGMRSTNLGIPQPASTPAPSPPKNDLVPLNQVLDPYSKGHEKPIWKKDKNGIPKVVGWEKVRDDEVDGRSR